MDSMVGEIDLMPTLLEMAKAKVPEQCEGRSLLPLLAGGGDWAERPLVIETSIEAHLRAVRTSTRKLVEAAGHGPEMYALGEDPLEQRNLAGTEREKEFEALKRALSAPPAPARGGPPVPPDADLLRRLKSLKYVQ